MPLYTTEISISLCGSHYMKSFKFLMQDNLLIQKILENTLLSRCASMNNHGGGVVECVCPRSVSYVQHIKYAGDTTLYYRYCQVNRHSKAISDSISHKTNINFTENPLQLAASYVSTGMLITPLLLWLLNISKSEVITFKLQKHITSTLSASKKLMSAKNRMANYWRNLRPTQAIF